MPYPSGGYDLNSVFLSNKNNLSNTNLILTNLRITYLILIQMVEGPGKGNVGPWRQVGGQSVEDARNRA